MSVFKSADFLIPHKDLLDKWAVIACDQFTSQREYWEETERIVGSSPSALRIIYPEAYLGEDSRIASINEHMLSYINSGIFRRFPECFIYVERTLLNGIVRRGLLGVIDLDAYDYSPNAITPIRATERTVVERIPPRMKIRENASLEISHVLLLCDDARHTLIEDIEKKELLYSFDLMQGGGHISGWLVQGEEAHKFEKRMRAYTEDMDRKYGDLPPVYFAVGDGNHSLATAKECWLRDHRERYTMVELENIRDEAQRFEPIHRIVRKVDVSALLSALDQVCAPNGYPVAWHSNGRSGTVTLSPSLGKLPIGILQSFLDQYGQGEVDYIHGEEAAISLSQADDSIVFLLPPIRKEDLFPSLASDGVLPRKTFSMGHAEEKRYYLEARRIG